MKNKNNSSYKYDLIYLKHLYYKNADNIKIIYCNLQFYRPFKTIEKNISDTIQTL